MGITERINEVMRDTPVGIFITMTGMSGATGLAYYELMAHFEAPDALDRHHAVKELDDDIVYGASAYKGVKGFVRVSELP